MPRAKLYQKLAGTSVDERCVALPGVWEKGVFMLRQGCKIQIGNAETHASHALGLHHHRGLVSVCCLNCGAYAVYSLKIVPNK